MEPLDELLLNHGGWVTLNSYVGRKGSWTRSREVGRVKEDAPDGVERSTVLHILATIKWPEGWAEDQEPHWVDKNPENETFDNVGLATYSMGLGSPGRPSELNIPHPTGSKEYREAYRKLRKAQFYEYNKKYQKKIRDEARQFRQGVRATASTEPQEPKDPVKPMADSYLSDMEQLLQKAIDAHKNS